tara:strand:- start:1958 stop:2179 length:222 start_codon:yes stop_codon:yes gene_type:complete
MDKAFDMIRDLVASLTGILVAVIGLGVVAGIVFGGNAFFVGDVLNNLIGVIQQLGDAGIVGLLAAALLYTLLK